MSLVTLLCDDVLRAGFLYRCHEAKCHLRYRIQRKSYLCHLLFRARVLKWRGGVNLQQAGGHLRRLTFILQITLELAHKEVRCAYDVDDGVLTVNLCVCERPPSTRALGGGLTRPHLMTKAPCTYCNQMTLSKSNISRISGGMSSGR